MKKKKQRRFTYIRHGSVGEIIKIEIKDTTGRHLESYKFDASNMVEYGRVIENLYKKYGFRPIISLKDSVLFRETKEYKNPEDVGFFDY